MHQNFKLTFLIAIDSISRSLLRIKRCVAMEIYDFRAIHIINTPTACGGVVYSIVKL